MKILITGAAGRVGRATYIALGSEHEVVGLDTSPSSTTDVVASITESERLRAALRGVDAVIHVAALHAPHVEHFTEEAFETVNVTATEALARMSVEAGVRSFVFTSTTALYGAASTQSDQAAWINEATVPRPRTVYHRTKLKAESMLEDIAAATALPVTVIRMSRCFPEPAPVMAAYRLHRGVDVRDVADAHALAATAPASGIRRFVVSGSTPFLPDDRYLLMKSAPEVIETRCPELTTAFRRRKWDLPSSIDRIYSPSLAMNELKWRAKYGFEEVLAQFDRRSLEVLPPKSHWLTEE
jgi:UDP-glucose 4-epimerase